MAEHAVKQQSRREELRWSKPGLPQSLSFDLFSGMMAGIAVAPMVLAIDTAVTEAAFGHRTLRASFTEAVSTLTRQPWRVATSRPFGAMLLLYGGTYATANVFDTITGKTEALQEGSSTSMWAKLGMISAVNMGLSLNKDNQLAKAFGTTATRALPPVSYGPLVIRDGLTLFATFSLPPMLVSCMPETWECMMSRLSIAQLLAPVASQVVVTPFHLLGLDLYYRAQKLPISERLRAMRRGWASSSMARMVRVVPGLAIGNVINSRMRTSFRQSKKS